MQSLISLLASTRTHDKFTFPYTSEEHQDKKERFTSIPRSAAAAGGWASQKVICQMQRRFCDIAALLSLQPTLFCHNFSKYKGKLDSLPRIQRKHFLFIRKLLQLTSTAISFVSLFHLKSIESFKEETKSNSIKTKENHHTG